MRYKDLIKMFKFNIKILINIKTIICAIAFCMIPLIFSIEVWSYTSIAALFEINLPLISVFLCCDLIKIEEINGCSEIYDINSVRKSQVLFIRMIIQISILLLMACIMYLFMIIKLEIKSSRIISEIDFWTMMYLFICNSILMGCIANFITVITKKIPIGIMLTFFYWIIWQVGAIHNIFNPFAYTIGLINYNENKVVNLFLSVIVFGITIVLYNKKEFFYRSNRGL